MNAAKEQAGDNLFKRQRVNTENEFQQGRVSQIFWTVAQTALDDIQDEERP